MTRIAAIGAGSWGTALANMLAVKGDPVIMWAYEAEVVEQINRRHCNETFLPDAPLHPGLTATGSLAQALDGAEVVISAAPSHAVRRVMKEAAPALEPAALVLSASKGLEADGLKRMTQVLAEVLPPRTAIVALSGPTFAREVYQQQPTACAVAGDDDATGRGQDAMSTPFFRVYRNDDPIGVELGGALKNVIAIAAGILEGLGLGNNPRAALITRGLAEITRLGVAMGARPQTFAGLAGIGDLVLTATGPLSRNRSLGEALGRGESLAEIQAKRVSVAEGVGTARAAVALGDKLGVELPIAREVSRVLFEGKPARQAIGELMGRPPTAEVRT